MSGEREVLSGFPMIEIGAEFEKTAQRLHRDTIIVDSCNTAEWDDEYILERLVPSGVNVMVKTIASQTNYHETGPQMAPWFAKMRQYGSHLRRATNVAEIEGAVADGRIAVVYALQNTKPLEDDLQLLEVYYELGVRVIQLTYNYRGYAGDGCIEEPDGGLSKWGVRLIEAMNDLGVVVDLSHAGMKTAADAIEASRHPVIFSHSNCRAVVDNRRNITDDVIRALADKKGYMGIAAFLPMLTEDRDRTPSLDEMLIHIDHVRDLVGSEFVGFGLDRGEGRTLAQYAGFNFPTSTFPTWEQRQRHLVAEIKSISQFINLTRALVDRGYPEDQIKGILGGNFLRVFGEVTGGASA